MAATVVVVVEVVVEVDVGVVEVVVVDGVVVVGVVVVVVVAEVVVVVVVASLVVVVGSESAITEKKAEAAKPHDPGLSSWISHADTVQSPGEVSAGIVTPIENDPSSPAVAVPREMHEGLGPPQHA